MSCSNAKFIIGYDFNIFIKSYGLVRASYLKSSINYLFYSILYVEIILSSSYCYVKISV